MRRWFTGLSLKQKLICQVCFFIISLAASIILANKTITQVKIGGNTYNGILLKNEFVDDLARVRLNINLLNSVLKSEIIDYDEDNLGTIHNTAKRLDLLMAEITEDHFNKPADPKQYYCGSCHTLERSQVLEDKLTAARNSWNAMKSITYEKILPALDRDEAEEALDFIDDEYNDNYIVFMNNSKFVVEALRDSQSKMEEESIADVKHFTIVFTVGGLASIVAVALLSYFFVQMIINAINKIVTELTRNADTISDEAGSTANASNSLAEMASEMAASLEETSAALEEITAMIARNDSNSTEASGAMKRNAEINDAANAGMTDLQQSMQNIKKDSDQIANIIKEIESIAFQTNLLALNAAVEAARAGEHGQGFAVVAEEVRNLAKRTSDSAHNSSDLIAKAINNVNEGLSKMNALAKEQEELTESVEMVSTLTEEISTASHEQSQGIGQINKSVGEMDSGTQQLAANAEELAAASEAVLGQTSILRDIIVDLDEVVEGRGQAQDKAAQRNKTSRSIKQLT